MGRALVNKTSSIDISESPRQNQNNFSEQLAASNIGPEQANTGQGEAVSATNTPPTQINRWQVMTTADEGLKNALYDWINTKMDGTRVTPDTANGRTKKLIFNFYGNLGKSIKPGEIGEFNLIFSYPPQTIQPTTQTVTQNSSQNSTV